MKYTEYRGVKSLVAAEVTKDEAGELTFGTPFQVAGVAELSKDTETGSDTHYYDNIPAIVIDSTGADTVKINASALDLDVLAKLTGQYYDETTGMLVEGERESKYYAIGYVTEKTDGSVIFVWRLKGKFAVPSSTHKTKNSGTDASGQELTYTGINTTHVFEKTGKTAKAVVVKAETVKQTEAKFFETVQTPDSVTVAA